MAHSTSTRLARWVGETVSPVLRVLSCAFGSRKTMLPAVYGQKPQAQEPTSRERVESVLASLDSNAELWRTMRRQDKAVLFRQCVDTVCEYGEDIAKASTRAKGSYGQGVGEEFLGLIPVVTYLSEVAECFERAEGGFPPPYAVNTRDDRRGKGGKQMIVDVVPLGLTALALGGFQGELWICPGYDATQGEELKYNEEHTEPGVGLVLGAGNQYPLALLDILHVLAQQSRVVVCKMNPVNEYMGPLLRLALDPLVKAGFVEFVYGGAEVGGWLVDHPLVKNIHLTGSEETYDRIVWKGRDKRNAKGPPPLGKPVGAELGCVTPYIIVPGEWDSQTIEYHAANVVAGLVHNAGHNCLGCEVLVTDSSWTHREEFLDAVRRQLDATSTRTAYYPGSEAKFARFDALFPDCENFGHDASAPPSGPENENGSHFPWKLSTGLTPATCAVDQENWCGVLQEVALDCGDSVESFCHAAASFANDTCWGSLSCCILLDAATRTHHQPALDALIADLRYGSVCVNVPCMVGFGLTRLSWGAWGDESEDRTRNIGSGNAKVHNSQFFDHVQKSVLYAPSRVSPPPYWHVTNRNVEETGKAALAFFKSSSLASLTRLIAAAVRG